jgi:hypothetical protein
MTKSVVSNSIVTLSKKSQNPTVSNKQWFNQKVYIINLRGKYEHQSCGKSTGKGYSLFFN